MRPRHCHHDEGFYHLGDINHIQNEHDLGSLVTNSSIRRVQMVWRG